MSKTLVAYFSAEGNTKVLAKTISDVVKGDIFEIAPTEKYTSADLNWQNKSSRSSVEMPVSYTHLDVYKRQQLSTNSFTFGYLAK